MADSLGMDVVQCPEHLIGVQLDFKSRHGQAFQHVVVGSLVEGLWHKLEDQVQVQLLLVVVCVEVVLQVDDVSVVDQLHDLQLSVLESAVLQHSFDGGDFVGGENRSLENNPKRPVAHHLRLCVLDLGDVAGATIVHLLGDYFHCAHVSDCSMKKRSSNSNMGLQDDYWCQKRSTTTGINSYHTQCLYHSLCLLGLRFTQCTTTIYREQVSLFLSPAVAWSVCMCVLGGVYFGHGSVVNNWGCTELYSSLTKKVLFGAKIFSGNNHHPHFRPQSSHAAKS